MSNFPKNLKPANAFLWFLLLLLFYFAYRHTRARFVAPISFDEEFFIWGGWLMTKGQVPYRDFFEPKPPVVFFANYIGLALFGFNGHLFRIVPALLAVMSICIFYVALLKRKMAGWLAALLAAQAALWLLGPEFHDSSINDSETYGFAFTLWGFSLASLSGAVEIRSRKIALQILSGICFGLAVFSKELFVFSVAPAWLLAARSRSVGELDWRQLLFSASGAVVVAIAVLAYLVSHQALGPYLDLLSFYREFASNYGVDIGRFPQLSGLSVVLHSWKALHGMFYNLNHMAFVLALLIALLALMRPGVGSGPNRIELGIALLAVLLGMMAISVGYCFWKHYVLMGVTGLLLLSVLGAETLSRFLAERTKKVSFIAFAVLCGCLCFVGWGSTRAMLKQPTSYQAPVWDPLVVQAIEQHSKPGDYILTAGGPLLYVAMDRKNPLGINFFVDEILPYVTAENRRLKMEILRANVEQHLPKVCYFPDWLRSRQNKYHELLFGPLLAEYHYVKVNEHLWYLPDVR